MNLRQVLNTLYEKELTMTNQVIKFVAKFEAILVAAITTTIVFFAIT